jgi:histidinol dehydrogenase
MEEPLKIVQLGDCSPEERQQLLKRSEIDATFVVPTVRVIVEEVKKRGDEALLEYSSTLDKVKLGSKRLQVSKEEIREAYKKIDPDIVDAIKKAAKAIEKFHVGQLPKERMMKLQSGVRAGQLVRPLEKVGAYVPGGLARYPSSLLMAVVPAKVAGVKKIIVCSPPKIDGEIDSTTLVAADVAGVNRVFKVGGAQAIAAMAYGTATIPRVDKIVGPGNIYVVAAKQLVSADVEIDFAAGPSEVLILADSSSDPGYVAVDLLAQAEHDPAAAAVLVTTSDKLAREVVELVLTALKGHPREEIVLKSLNRYGRVVLAKDLAEAIEFVNDYAPEHLQIMVERPSRLLKLVNNAGSIFVGPYAPVSAGDLAVGPNHILPTGGAARRRSGLSVLDFIKLPTVQMLTKEGLGRVAGVAEKLAEAEGLPGHAQSIRRRFRK